MKRLIRYLKNYRIQCVLAPLFKMLEATFELFVPLVIAALIDNISGPADRSFILKCFIILIILGTVGLISSCTAQYFAAVAATGFSKELRHDLFEHLLKLDYPAIDKLGTSTMITRMTADVNTAQNGVNMFLRLFLRSPFIVAGAVVMAFTIDVKAALLFLLVVIVSFLAVGLSMKSNIPKLKLVQKKLDRILKMTRENLSGARVIRAFHAEDIRLERFKRSNEELSLSQLSAGHISGLLGPLTYVIINLAIAALIKIGDIRVSEGALTTGQVVALYNYMSQILLELIKFANLIVTMNKALASAERISDVFDISPQNASGNARVSDTDPEYAVEFDNVSLKYYEGADESLSNISFKVKKGETIGVIGSTGSGKTSLVNLIPHFYEASRGTVKVWGQDVRQYDDGSLRKLIGVVPQKAVLFSGSIADNLRWGAPDASDEELIRSASIAQASDVIAAKGGLDALIEQGGKNLSGGQRQRLTIARALAGRPKILILDDSSSALDNLTDRNLRSGIRDLDSDHTVFIVAQRLASVRDADRIIVLDDGEMAGMGTHDELMSSCRVYKEIYESQFGADNIGKEGA